MTDHAREKELSDPPSPAPRQTADETGWQPIETAPKDGMPFRVFAPSLLDADFNPSGSAEACYDPERIIAAKWDGQHDVWVTVFVDDATHWMPLPDPPALPTPREDR